MPMSSMELIDQSSQRDKNKPHDSGHVSPKFKVYLFRRGMAYVNRHPLSICGLNIQGVQMS